MKFVSQDNLCDYAGAAIVGGLKGAAIGMALSFGTRIVLMRRTNLFSINGGFHRAMIMVSPSIFMGVVGAEWAGLRFAAKQRQDQHRAKGFANQDAPQTPFSYVRWLEEHKYSAITAGWAASLAGAFALINRNSYLSRSQKLVQARMLAQGLTVIMLLLSVAARAESQADDPAEKAANHARSWEFRLPFTQAANTPL